ncbi:hypothetical protein V1318_20875, partial [Lysobacter sp. CCNWLW3]|uniref:hypothetical protein n=1 Tax=unclassified Lysobacter TaxID=2635362 RepID=UPI002FD25063
AVDLRANPAEQGQEQILPNPPLLKEGAKGRQGDPHAQRAEAVDLRANHAKQQQQQILPNPPGQQA